MKKLLTADSGLQPGEQRLIYRGKERQNGDYLDRCGVKDHSKVILMESPEFRERKFIEMRRNAKIQAAHRLIDDVLMEVDKLAEQVSIFGSFCSLTYYYKKVKRKKMLIVTKSTFARGLILASLRKLIYLNDYFF